MNIYTKWVAYDELIGITKKYTRKGIKNNKLHNIHPIGYKLNKMKGTIKSKTRMTEKIINKLLLLCSTAMNCTIDEMTSNEKVKNGKNIKYRKANKCYARHIFCYIIYVEYNKSLSLKDIGSIIGDRDHTTVMNSVVKVKNLIKTEDEYFEEYLWVSNKFAEYIENNIEDIINEKEERLMFNIEDGYLSLHQKLNHLKSYINGKIQDLSKCSLSDKDVRIANNSASFVYKDLLKFIENDQKTIILSKK